MPLEIALNEQRLIKCGFPLFRDFASELFYARINVRWKFKVTRGYLIRNFLFADPFAGIRLRLGISDMTWY